MFIRGHEKGFTLIELLVVISIISLLSSIVLASLNSARQKGRNAQRLSDMAQIKNALELYYNDYGNYPVVTNGVDTSWRSECASWGALANNAVIPGFVPTYIKVLPKDPIMVPANSDSCYIYRSDGAGFAFLMHDNSPPWSDGAIPVKYADPTRPTHAWKLCYGTTQCAW